MKISEIRQAYEELSSTFSKTARTLALSGIAIAWFFMPYFKGAKYMLSLDVFAICLFVLVLLSDLLQNYILSKKWYAYYKQMKVEYNKEEGSEIKEPENKNRIGWFLYDLKFWLLLVSYIFLAVCFILFIVYNSYDDANFV